MQRAGVILLSGLVFSAGALLTSAQTRLPPDAPRPIDAADSLWAEELTSMEIRDALRAGTTTIIVGTGGVEQNGPYVVGGKHNYVLQTVLPYIARAIGRSLIAPIVKFVPEGRIEPVVSGHMAYAGTIGVEQATFEALLTDICRSYKAHGFLDIVLLGDSGGNQTGMENVANALNRKWSGERAADWRNGIHDDIYYEAQIAVQDPKHIRMEQRLKAGLFSLHGVELAPISRTVELGQKLAAYRADITAKAYQASYRRLRGN